MKVILISGKAQHGKDSFANILKEKLEKKEHRVLIAHFGDLVKFVCEKYFNWDGLKCQKGRALLQKIGGDVVRLKKPNFWVRFVKDVLYMFEDEWDYVLIADCRYANEVTWNEEYDITTVRVKRLNFESELTEEQKNHSSETELDDYNFDCYIESESGLDNLEIQVEGFLKWLDDMEEK